MISTEFAANEQWDDALLSMSLLFQPWRWKTGTEQQSLRSALAKEFSTKSHSVHLFLSGRAALFHIVSSIPLQQGSEVIVTGFTCEAVVVPLIAAGLTPVYADIDTSTFSMTPAEVEKKLTPRTSAIILQHTFGIPPHRKEILAIAKKHKLTVIEDIAHGWERGVFEPESYPTIKLVSFGRSKSFSSVFGGAVITENTLLSKTLNDVSPPVPYPTVISMIRLLCYKPVVIQIKTLYRFGFLGKIAHVIAMRLGLLLPEISSKEKRGEYDVFFDKQYPNALAILALHQLKKRPHVQNHRKTIYDVYTSFLRLSSQKGLQLSRVPVLVENRENLIEEAGRYKIYFGKWYEQPVAPKQIELSRVGYKTGMCPVSESVCKQIINLPTNVSKAQAKDIAQLVSSYQNT